jgi:N-acetyl-gamma-glutamyl-phosphate reductase
MSAASPLRVGIAGATGYTGCELVRLLARHDRAQVVGLAHGPGSPDERMSVLFPELAGICDLPVTDIETLLAAPLDVVFLALPHCAAMQAAAQFLARNVRVIDLSADYRLRDVRVYEATYKTPHQDHANLAHAVYGLCEWYRAQIAGARLVANPGCYVTSALLPLLPLLKAKLIDPARIIIDAKSGVSGAGKKVTPDLHFCAVNESFKAYGVFSHRHAPEIEQELSVAAGAPVQITFTPHLLPIQRGILSTMYVECKRPNMSSDLAAAYAAAYANEFFVRVKGAGATVQLQHVTNTNFCDISFFTRGAQAIIVSALDNLVKGASGQAVQNFNIMTGCPETTGLI